MSLIVLRCPKTGLHFSTGMQGERESFVLPKGGALAHCPHCRRVHKWNADDIVWVEFDRWSEDPQTEDCYIKAQEGAEKAGVAPTEEGREFWRKVEKKWLYLAAGYSSLAAPRKQSK